MSEQIKVIKVGPASLVVMDAKTKTQYEVPPSESAVRLTMVDGQFVRVYPSVLRTMVRVGQSFSGIGTVKNRLMRRLR